MTMKLTRRELCHSLIHLLICLLCAVTFARALRCSPTRSRVHGKEILKMKLQNFLLFPVLDFWSLIWMKGKALYTQPANFWISNDRCILNFGRLFRTSHSHYASRFSFSGTCYSMSSSSYTFSSCFHSQTDYDFSLPCNNYPCHCVWKGSNITLRIL